LIAILPYSDEAAMAIFADLDLNDRVEAALLRGDGAEPLAMFADWRRAGPGSLIAADHVGRPFAIMALTPLGPAGVASVALMARDHRRWRQPLTALARHWRRAWPGYCAERGVTRAECRSWTGHPTAFRLLEHIGFRLEAVLRGFGGGEAVFAQYAWTAPATPAETPAEET
jgi:hypothetical protein